MMILGSFWITLQSRLNGAHKMMMFWRPIFMASQRTPPSETTAVSRAYYLLTIGFP